MCLPLSLLLLLPVPVLLLVAAVTELSAHGPLGVGAAAMVLWTLWRAVLDGVRALRSWWSRLGVPPPGRPPR